MLSKVIPILVSGAFCIGGPHAQIPLLRHFDGPAPRQHFGTAVGGAGDVDADGFHDIIVGATDGNGAGTQIGMAQVFSGRDGRLLHTLRGAAQGDAFGAAVAGAGDVNGDGYADLVVGARYDRTRAIFAGAVRVFSGRDGRVLHAWLGEASGDRLGISVAGAGDVDGDGSADVVAGAYFANANGFWSGSAYVWSGRTGKLLWKRHGDKEFHFFGAAVAGAGDVNRDGFADVVVGAYGDDTAAPNGGMARVFSGRDGSVLHSFFGDSPQGALGGAVGGVGDFDHDGHDDVIAGAWLADTVNGRGSGLARVFSGRNGSILYTFVGDDPDDHFGFAVAGAGDANGDGTPDCVVGAYFDDNNGDGSGSARIFSGADGRPLATFDGDSPDDRFGVSVSGAGDTNGDGFDDVVVGALFDDNNGPDSGSARVLATCGAERYGAPSGLPARLSLAWKPGTTLVAAGTLDGSGANALAPGGLVVGLREARQQIGSLTLLIDLTPGRWLFVPLAFDATGRASLALSLQEPALAGIVLFAQAVDTSAPSLSNGVRLLFAR